MPLRTEVAEFKKHCDAMIQIIKNRPELLTELERLDIEVSLTRVLSAIVDAQQKTNLGRRN